ncbi:MAG TPA: GerMN domain-containing protein [Vicinamibacterales bacterium]|nr:GerMN domain-containing protein [Vicinamibacterales bacterium]
MTTRRGAFVALLVVAGASIGWLLFVGLPRWYSAPARNAAVAPPSAPAAEDVRKIKARLFYVSDDGTRLTSIERDVPFAEQTVAQARRIIEAQLAPMPTPPADAAAQGPVSAIPAGTALRAIFVTDQGTAFVDLSREVAAAHPGGSLNELLTIYTIVQALTTNLPAITSVQLLVDGREIDTLAGHVDVRRPLARADQWVTENISQ